MIDTYIIVFSYVMYEDLPVDHLAIDWLLIEDLRPDFLDCSIHRLLVEYSKN